MKFVLFILLFIPLSRASIKHFPLDDYDYRPGQDVGIGAYQAFSLHGTKKVVLTFDDGPHLIQTPKILDLLKSYNVKATFFINTAHLNQKKLLLAHRILKEGHILASHDYNHRDNNREDEELFRREFLQSLKDIKSIEKEAGVHQKGIYFRFPFGYYGKNPHYHHLNVIKDLSHEIYGENCINIAFWDIDTKDWGPTMGPEEIAQNVKAHMEGGWAPTVISENNKWKKIRIKIKNPPQGGVILLHDTKKETFHGTKLILKMAKEKNWEVVPLDGVKEFSYENKNCEGSFK